jgi:hypothetical protein
MLSTMKICALICVLFTLQAHAGWKKTIIQDALNAYGPVALNELNKPLEIFIKEDNSESGSSNYSDTEVKVEIFTGLLKNPRLTQDTLRMMICHELGHIFGGKPKRNIPMDWDGPVNSDGFSYLSAEGQADYFAGSECFRKITKEKVSNARIAEAGLKFLTIVKDFPISLSTPDKSIAPLLMRDSYPGRQCRLDTIVAGAKGAARPACWYR